MNQQDLNQISARGISEQQIEHQLEQIKNGFPFLKLEGAAAIGKGTRRRGTTTRLRVTRL